MAVRAIADLREQLLLIARNSQGVQIGLRVELLTMQEFQASIGKSVRRALANRLDLKNTRARVMDARRRVEIAANRLEAVFNLRVEGDIGTKTGTKPLDFRGRRSNFRVGLGFTAPLDLVNERNAYRDAQIAYQRARRDYMALEDQIKLAVRTSWRELDALRKSFETARRRIRVSASEYDITVESALEPPAPGARPSNQNTGLNLLNALNSVLTSQNDLIRIWVDYERSRLNIHRDMGMMDVDPRGLWTDSYYQRGAARQQDGTSTPAKPLPAVGRNHEFRDQSHRRRKLANSGGTLPAVRQIGERSDAAQRDGIRAGEPVGRTRIVGSDPQTADRHHRTGDDRWRGFRVSDD